MKRGTRQTAQISKPPQGVKASQKFLMLRFAEKEKLVDKGKSSSRTLIISHYVGVTKPFENQIKCHNERVDAK